MHHINASYFNKGEIEDMSIACITGASSGIGEELAKILAGLGYDLIIVGRRTEKLKALSAKLTKDYDIRCKCITCDLSEKDSCIRLGNRLANYDLDILINNAGFGELGAFYETEVTNDLKMIDVNVSAVHILTKAVLPAMLKNDFGYIMNVASSAGLFPGGPYMPTYYATKSYVTSLTTAIHSELRDAGSNVHVCMLCPGPVDTAFNDVAGVKFALPGISAEYCASYALRQMFAGKLTIIPTLTMKVTTFLPRLFPRQLSAYVCGRQQMKKR